MIRLAKETDVDQTAELHAKHIKPLLLFAELGKPFLKILHRSLIKSRYGVIVVSEIDSKIAGFCSAAYDAPAAARELVLKKFHLLLLTVLSAVLKKPAILKKIIQLFIHLQKTKKDPIRAEFLTIVVEPGHRKQGIAAKMFDLMKAEMKAKGIKKVRNSAVHDDIAVNRMSHKFNFELAGTFYLYGIKMNLYHYNVE
ncbi:MAG: GNAT family N-acetyltransferase [Elusimicrobia bacterium]|nr:GNAT family N-acetyltransferase [Elusimicrobiota bacterium]